MKIYYYIVLPILLLVYGLLNFYVGLRSWQFLTRISNIPAWPYWLVFTFISFAWILGRLTAERWPAAITNSLSVIGSYWMALFFYLLLILTIIDLVRIADRKLHFLPASFTFLNVGGAVLILVVGLMIYGIRNAHNPRITNYDLTITKDAGSIKKLNVVMVSDIHLGLIVHKDRLDRLINDINLLQPDLVLLPGDIIDESIDKLNEWDVLSSLRDLKPRYGVYACLGNHEYISGDVDKAIHFLEGFGIQLLRDRYLLAEDSFYLVGRDVRMGQHSGGAGRQDLSVLLDGIDHSRPIILLDHEPFDLDEPDRARVDLQLSGHTHSGQIFPLNYITAEIFENYYGYLKKEHLQVIVSCGFGTWGPPIRIGNHPEIVNINITFEPAGV